FCRAEVNRELLSAVRTLFTSCWLHNCGSLSLVVVFISLFASELRVLESRSSVTDRNLERIASLLAVPTILPRSFPSTKYSSFCIDWIFQIRLRSGLLSAFILTTFSRPAHAAATPSITESRIRQGRLHAAENATSFHLSTSHSEFASPISTIGILF